MIIGINLIFLCLRILAHGHGIHAIECYTCSNVTSICECHTIKTCPSDSDVCSSEYIITDTGKRYTLGCKQQQKCTLYSTGGSPVVGRAVSQTCSDCCHKANCNRQLCQEPDPYCSNKASFDCASIGVAIDVCADTSHAMTNCRNFCGLCASRDGGWAAWTVWSSCDVTCGNGTISRSRKCSDPKPQECGKSCTGPAHDMNTCFSGHCPVHGGWTTWSPWGSCSVTCDIGMQRRDRTCSNPHPALSGDFCIGDSKDDRLCYMVGCRDGGWSLWSSWSTCSRTCGDGLTKRSRVCDNPISSVIGKYCSGDPSETTLCNVKQCQAKVSFTATNGTYTYPADNWIFSHVSNNIGDGYSRTTGMFTCKYPGIYSFSANMEIISDYKYYIRKNGHNIVKVDTPDGGMVTGSLVTHLDIGDKVYVWHYFTTFSIGEQTFTSSQFSGVLLHADDG